MARRLRLKISRILRSCRSDDSASLPSDPSVPSFLRLPLQATDLTPGLGRRRSSLNPHLRSRSFAPYGCGGCEYGRCSRSTGVIGGNVSRDEFLWKEESDFHAVVAAAAAARPATLRRKVYCSSASEGGERAWAPQWERKRRRVNNRKRKPASVRHRVSTSSGDCGLFSSEDPYIDGVAEDKHDYGAVEMLLISSSRSCTTEKSSGLCNPEEIEGPDRKKLSKKKNRSRRSRGRLSGRRMSNGVVEPFPAMISSPARLSTVFRRLASVSCGGGGAGGRPIIEGPLAAAKVRESFAVVKRSECPYEDFKGSMVEMIVEKEMFDKEDLEQLLFCFLSLNSSCHHRAIVEAFSDIWEALFCRRR
ncbi:hypothetical protein SAY87_025373 [Trapa incisa]|uniref:Transcription repressor n=1 Tax=Trapa incisa TaxID=236973 RepID=A0AAN7GAS8_9MYRT|nr:hypothetical protein SAY87_025373 [Trapa incisa]